MADNQVIVYSDKTVLKISGLKIRGLNTRELERVLAEKLNSFVRVIGVTGTNIDMDVYGISPEQLQRDKDGILQAVSTVEGITATELIELSHAERALPVDFNSIPSNDNVACARERWMQR